MQADLLSEEGVRAVGKDDDVCPQFTVGLAGRDADHTPVFPQEIGDRELGVDLGPGCFGGLGMPPVKRRSQHRVGVIRGLGKLHRPVGRAQQSILSQHQVALLDDRPFERGRFLEAGDHLLGRIPVENAAPDVLRTRECSALEDNRRQAGVG